MKTGRIIALLAAVGLAGCSVVLKDAAVAKLQADCAAKGLQFHQETTKETELVVISQAEVSGECVGPGDPRYVPPMASK